MSTKKGISSFSILLLMAVTAVVGIACFSMLRVQYTPSSQLRSISVSYSYSGASARVVETEVTSKIEGVLSGMHYCTKLSSISDAGRGSVTMEIAKRSDIEAARFEVASAIRNIYSSLPEACSYPSISVNARGQKNQTAISFSIRSPLPSKDIAAFVESTLMYPLSAIDGVSSVSFYGHTPYEWVITFDADKTAASGISAFDIRSAFVNYYSEQLVGISHSGSLSYGVKLRNDTSEENFDQIPIKKVGDRVVYLGEIASYRYQEALPSSYYRINGLNVLTLSIEVASDANLVRV